MPGTEAEVDRAPGTLGEEATLRHNVRVNAWHGGLQAVAINLVNPFLGIDLIRLGAGNAVVGLLNALPPLATSLSSLAGARVMSRVAHPKRAIAGLFLAARLCYLLLAGVNLLQGSPLAPWLLVGLVWVLNVPTAVGNLSWQSFIGEVLPPPVRARALALRSRYASLAGVVAVLAAGVWIRQDTGVGGYVPLYTLATAVGVAEVLTFLRLREPQSAPLAPAQGVPWRLWRQARLRAYAVGALVFYFGWVMAWPLFLRYQVTDARATNLWMAAFTATNALAAALASGVWARLGDRFGAGRVLPWALILLAGVPAAYGLGPGLWGLLGTNVWGGAVGAGVNLLLLVRLLELAPSEDRMMAMGAVNTLLGVAGCVGPLAGVWLLQFLPLHVAFFVSAFVRFSGGALLWLADRVGRPGAPGVPRALDGVSCMSR